MELRVGKFRFSSERLLFVGIISILWLGCVHSLTNEEDVYALNQLYTALNVPILSGWTSNGGDPCQDNWQGVLCAGPNVTLLQLPGLSLTGNLGSSLENFTTLIVLDLSKNLLSGGLPFQLPPHAQQILLSSNQFTGNLPFSVSDLSNLALLNVSDNFLSGSLPDIFDQSELLTTLDLSSNDFAGPLPQSFGKMTSLSELYLQENHFSGTVNILANLPFKTLDISNNNFTGWIPQEFKHIPVFKYTGNSFNTFPAPPPPPLVPPPPPTGIITEIAKEKSPTSKSKQTSALGGYLTIGRLVGIAVAALLTVAVAVLVVLFFAWRTQHREQENQLDPEKSWDGPLIAAYKGEQQKKEQEPLKPSISEFSMLKPPPVETYALGKKRSKGLRDAGLTKTLETSITAKAFSIAELQVATGSFDDEHLLGDGTLGKVYKANLTDGKAVAVKKLDYSITRVADQDFLQFLAKISCLRHPYITELVGYCLEHGEHLLLYEFVGNGNLHENLHSEPERSRRLSWDARVKVALGVAEALEYLHEGCIPAVLHRNVTSVNILLDHGYKPYLSDCGLATLVSLGEQHQAAIGHLEFSGYSAPEHTKSGIYTTLSDVYSFGVIMLELLTGRKALDSSRPRPEQFLAKWAILDIDALSNMVDPALAGTYTTVSLSRFSRVISECLQADPEFRPPMSEVVQSLQAIVKLHK